MKQIIMLVMGFLFAFSANAQIPSLDEVKKLFLGKNFYCVDDYSTFETVEGDRVSNIPILKVMFKCTDIYEKTRPLNTEFGTSFYYTAIIENAKYGKIVIDICNSKDESKNNVIMGFVSVNKYNQLIKKYGQFFGKKVALREISIGMTKSMVREAWGLPEKINQVSMRDGIEQWIYDNDYLYFKKGKLVEKQRF